METRKRRKIGRPYKPYSELTMEQCLKDIKDKKLSTRKASVEYGIPRSSIILKMKAIKDNNVALPRRSCIFTTEEEESFVQHAIKMSEFGFPISSYDLRCIVKMYLDSCGRQETRFVGNFPGKRWAESYVQRHNDALSQRFATNIKRARAAINEAVINSYFDNLEKELENIVPENIYNYDETNLVDDPGKKKILAKRGCKYPESIKNSSKASLSIMMCGNAAGEMCPPYVNYKAEKMWDTWTEGGPLVARYNRTKSS